MRRSIVFLGTVAVVCLSAVGVALPSYAYGPRPLYVSPGASNPADNSCSAAGYGSIQAAVNAARPGTKIVVCTGTYNEQVTIESTNLTLVASGTAVIQPTTPVVNASDEDTAQPIVSLVDVKPGSHVNVSGLTLDGSQVESAVNGCSTNLVGALYQATSGENVSGSVNNLTVENVTPTNSGCGTGQGVFVQTGPSGAAGASVRVQSDHISGYGKNGVTCTDVGAVCTVTRNTITTSPTSLAAQNGVQVGFGAYGSVTRNVISGNDWTAYTSDTNPQVQSDFGSGVLLYAAGINKAGQTVEPTTIAHNSLSDNQIGVEVVDSQASVSRNSITEGAPGIADSIGIFGVGCDAYCGYFNDDNGSTLSSVAQNGQPVSVVHNQINFAATPSGSYGIWLGDKSWTGGSGYAAPAGSETVHVAHNSVTNVLNTLVIGGGATT